MFKMTSLLQLLLQILNLGVIAYSASNGQQCFFADTEYSTFRSDWNFENTCTYYKAIQTSKKLHLTCGSICAIQNNCLFYAVTLHKEYNKCILCMVKEPNGLEGWHISDNNYTTSSVFLKCVNMLNNIGNHGSFNGESYWLFKPEQMPDLGPLTSAGSEVQVAAYTITLKFKTYFDDGILFFTDSFYGTSTNGQHDFVGAYMKDGYVKHSLDNWAGTGNASTTTTYTDGSWHLLKLWKNNDDLEICVDGSCTTGVAGASGGVASVVPFYYFGGIPSSLKTKAQLYLGVNAGFMGCISDLTLNGIAVGNPAAQFNMQNCCLGKADN